LNINAMRLVDVWFGQIACFKLSVWRRVFRWMGLEKAAAGPARKIVFIKLIEQGATVLACDALRRAAAKVGAENVYFCVFEENRPILDLLGMVPRENVLVVRGDSPVRMGLDLIRVLLRMRRLGIDTAIDLEFFSRGSAVMAYLSGAKRRVGCHRFTTEGPYRGDLMTHRVQYNPYLHTAAAYSLMVDVIDGDPGDIPLPKVIPPHADDSAVPRFAPSAESQQKVRALLAEHGVGEEHGPIVLLNPNASDLMPLRKWPTERFVELGKRLLAEDATMSIVITGAPSERESAEAVCREIGSERVCCLAGKTTLYDLMTLYALSTVLVTNDSGPGHFAVMTGIQTVVLFGPETPQRYSPLGDRTHIIWEGLACSPCVNAFNHRFSPCVLNRCMLDITVDEVLRAVLACAG